MVIKMVTNFESRAKKSLEILQKIDNLLNQLEKVDPYGDLVQNFEDMYRERETKRLIKLIKGDLRRGWWKISYKEDVWQVRDSWEKDYWGVSGGPIFSPDYTYPEERKIIETYMKRFK